jgi:ABC-type transport system substrate-binding protein
MRPLLTVLALAAFILASCGTAPEPPPATSEPASTPVPPATPTTTPSPRRAPLLRVAILGETTTTNVWALFDEAGTDFWNHATQASYWPRLYRLAPPHYDFQPVTAKGMPFPVDCGSDICTATVTLQPDLIWTDGSAFTADDVVFTINTVLQFRLGLNWESVYNPEVLERVEALDETTVKYYFKIKPTVADWQYGTLLGPVVNRAYWQPRIVDAVTLLPDEALLPTIQELENELDEMQTRVSNLNLSLNTMAPESEVYQDTSRQARHLQEELNSVYNKLEKNRAEYEMKLAEAREALFSLANANEPTLGPWQFASRLEGVFENRVNLGTPFGDPWFDRVQYITFSSEAAAARVLINGEVDVILHPDGLSSEAVSQLENDPEITLMQNTTRSARFLAFNHTDPYLADQILHRALACMVDPQALVERLDGDVAPLSGFVLDGFWQFEEATLPCAGMAESARLAEAVGLLKSAGYSWETEPAVGVEGRGLRNPDKDIESSFSLLVSDQDTLRAEAAEYIVGRANILGLNLDVQLRPPDDLLYAVYGSGDYDMALLGWRLSTYPAYLCEWFDSSEQNPFAYSGSNLKEGCDAWNGTSVLDEAREYVFEVQSGLMQDLPLIPLYVEMRTDAFRNITFPFEAVTDGLSGLYSMPAFAIPILR